MSGVRQEFGRLSGNGIGIARALTPQSRAAKKDDARGGLVGGVQGRIANPLLVNVDKFACKGLNSPISVGQPSHSSLSLFGPKWLRRRSRAIINKL